MVYFQGHASPGIYARAFLEGTVSIEQMRNFRRELGGDGLSSYPHPWLMPGFWQFPTVSMGLSPIMAIYQARFNRYLEDRGLKPKTDAKVWAFIGDAETFKCKYNYEAIRIKFAKKFRALSQCPRSLGISVRI